MNWASSLPGSAHLETGTTQQVLPVLRETLSACISCPPLSAKPPSLLSPTFPPALGFHLLGLPICLSVHLPSPTHAVAKAQLPGTTHILPLQFGEAGAGTFDRSVVGRPRAGGLVGEGCGLWGTGRLVLAEGGGSQASEPGIPWPHEVSRPMLGRAAAGRPSQSSEAPEGGGWP